MAKERDQAFMGDLDEYFNVGDGELMFWPEILRDTRKEPYTLAMLDMAMEMGAPMREEWWYASVVWPRGRKVT